MEEIFRIQNRRKYFDFYIWKHVIYDRSRHFYIWRKMHTSKDSYVASFYCSHNLHDKDLWHYVEVQISFFSRFIERVNTFRNIRLRWYREYFKALVLNFFIAKFTFRLYKKVLLFRIPIKWRIRGCIWHHRVNVM